MDEFAFARVLHVLGVVLWIGGVAMVTIVLFPAMAQLKSRVRANGVFWPYRKPLRSPGTLHHAYCRLERLLYGAYPQRMEPLYRTALLVDACHGPGVADLYLDAVRGGTLGAAQTGGKKHSARP